MKYRVWLLIDSVWQEQVHVDHLSRLNRRGLLRELYHIIKRSPGTVKVRLK